MKTDPTAECRFFSPGDACRVTLDAYRTAADDLRPPRGQAWMVDEVPYASPSDFADAFMAQLSARLGLLALDRLGTFAPPEDRGDPWRLAYLAAPEKMGEIISIRETELRHSEAGFIGLKENDLPGASNAVHNQAKGDADSAE